MTSSTLPSLSPKKIHRFQTKILDFYRQHKRELPWRKTTDPYKILLSEIMLQQTQVPRVIPYYTQWIQQWPSIHDLAQAPRKEVLATWMGLGYNSRAVRFHQAAETISTTFKGDVLQAMEHYAEVPGVGPYTSKAVQIFAANKDVVTVDTNIRRIFIHEFDLPESISDNDLWKLAEHCLPKGKSREWHNALMDYGSQVLTSQKTKIPPKTKQSTFEGSDRQIRAQILRLLLREPLSLKQLLEKIPVSQQRIQLIIEKLEREELLNQIDRKYTIKEK